MRGISIVLVALLLIPSAGAVCIMNFINGGVSLFSCVNTNSPYSQCRINTIPSGYHSYYTGADCEIICQPRNQPDYWTPAQRCDQDGEPCQSILETYCSYSGDICTQHEDCDTTIVVDRDCDGLPNRDTSGDSIIDPDCTTTNISVISIDAVTTPHHVAITAEVEGTNEVWIHIDDNQGTAIVDERISNCANNDPTICNYDRDLLTGQYTYWVRAGMDPNSDESNHATFAIPPVCSSTVDCNQNYCHPICVPSDIASGETIDHHENASSVVINYSASAWMYAQVRYSSSYNRQQLDNLIQQCVDSTICNMPAITSSTTIDAIRRFYSTIQTMTLQPGGTVYSALLVSYPEGNQIQYESPIRVDYDIPETSLQCLPNSCATLTNGTDCFTCNDANAVCYADQCCTPSTTDICYDGCGVYAPLDTTCGTITCPASYCDGTTLMQYPTSESNQCQDGTCVAGSCQPIPSPYDDSCQSTTSSCDDINGLACIIGQVCWFGDTMGGFTPANDSTRCCTGLCASPCYNIGLECSATQLCGYSSSMTLVNNVTVASIWGNHECCPAECITPPLDCGDYPEPIYMDECLLNCWHENQTSAWQDVPMYGTTFNCCPVNAYCDYDAPVIESTCEDHGFTSCPSGQYCYTSDYTAVENAYTGQDGPLCCDTLLGNICDEPPTVRCNETCILDDYKCENNTNYRCLENANQCNSWEIIGQCPYGCDGTSCDIPPPANTCEDTDGGDDTSVKGLLSMTVNGVVSEEHEDFCVDEETVHEYYCVEGGYEKVDIDCDDGACFEGVCDVEDTGDPHENILAILRQFPEFITIAEDQPFDFARRFRKRFMDQFDKAPPEPITFSMKRGGADFGSNGLYEPDSTTVTDYDTDEFEIDLFVHYNGFSDGTNMLLTIKNRNRLPHIDSPENITITAGEPWAYQIQFTDPDVEFHQMRFESGLLELESVRIIDGVIRWEDPKVGRYRIILHVEDSHGGKVQRPLDLIVIPRPITDQMLEERKKPLFTDFGRLKMSNEKFQEVVPEPDVLVVLEEHFDRMKEAESETRKISELPEALREKWEQSKKVQREVFIKKQLIKYKNTTDHLKVRKSSAIIKRENKTIIKIILQPDRVMYNVTIYESIPKEVAQDVSELEFTVQPIIIESDPLIMWHFEKIEQEQELTYTVKKAVDLPETKTITIAEEITLEEIKNPRSLLKLFLPLLLIPMVSMVLIYFSHFRPRKKKVIELPVNQQL